ncbi:MAG: methyltransferase domain-containing protein [Nitrosopumilaceae archaeon]
MKSFLKKSLTKKIQHIEDRSILEQRWTNIYQKSSRSKFYSIIKKRIKDIPSSKFSLEYGCSIGTLSKFLAESSQNVFGVDRSFSAIQIAQKNSKDNLDYLVADSLSPLFGRMKFNLILALNLLELVEPMEFLEQIQNQISKGFLVITDPYDYDRGKNSVRKPLDEATLRKKLQSYGFQIIQETDKPSNLTWNLKLNPRTTLHYKVDLVMAKK